MLDLKIVGGQVVDGTGEAARSADVGVRDGRIVEVGKVSDSAKRTVDAAGALVTPGFCDMHTHYDGQVSWDEDMAPSSLLGVTTCVLGSCGVGFAPVHEQDRSRLIELMEGVEDIPGSALSEGIRWNWQSFGEYMDAIDAAPHSIDMLAQVPHDALRVFVMRERALAEEPATAEDINEMKRLLREALMAGAAGFSTGRSDNHRSADGKPTPASEATDEELIGLGEAFLGLKHGVLQAVSDFDMRPGDPSDERFESEWRCLEAMARASGRPFSLSLMQRDHAPKQWKALLSKVEASVAAGLEMRVQVASRAIGVLLGLEATFHPFMGFPSYKAISSLPLAERVQRMRNPELKAKILAEKSEKVAGDGSPIPPLADFFLQNLQMVAMRLFRLGEDPVYEPHVSTCFAAEALKTKRPVLDLIYDAILEDEGMALLYFPLYNYSENNLNIVREMLTHPLSLPGLSDGGAHVGTICDASFPVFLLTHWGRDRPQGRIPIEELIRMQARDTARYMGLRDRGEIAVGQRADINILDFDRLRLSAPHMRRDLPASGRRLLQHAEGIVATFVGGVPIAEGGELTGERPGRLVRMG